MSNRLFENVLRKNSSMIVNSNREAYTISRSKYYAGTSNGTDIDTTYRSAHEVLVDCHSIRVCYGNYYQDERTNNLSPYTLNASLEYNGKLYPLFFENGSNKTKVELGSTVWTKPLGIHMQKGDRFFIRSHVVTEPGMKYPTGLTLVDNFNQEGKMDGDVTAGTWVRTTQTIFGFSPLVVTGIPSSSYVTFKSLGICGDSISQGAGSTISSIDGNLMGEFGMFQNGAKRAGWGYVSMGANGQKASDFADPSKRINRLNFFKNCDLVVVEYGTNDLPDPSTTLTKLKDNIKLIHKLFWDMGIDTVQTTIVPRTNSTDGWKTLSNQTPVHANTAGGSSSMRSQLNDWIRNNNDGIKCLEIADLVESSRNSGLWRTDQITTADGIHTNDYGHHHLCAPVIESYLRKLK